VCVGLSRVLAGPRGRRAAAGARRERRGVSSERARALTGRAAASSERPRVPTRGGSLRRAAAPASGRWAGLAPKLARAPRGGHGPPRRLVIREETQG